MFLCVFTVYKMMRSNDTGLSIESDSSDVFFPVIFSGVFPFSFTAF